MAKKGTVSQGIEEIIDESMKGVKRLLQDSGVDEINAAKGLEWRSTPNLLDILETNGLGEFRNPITKELIPLKKRSGRNRNRARVLNIKISKTKKISVSLQKFIALIYHANLNGSASTRVIDGNRDNLSRTNVIWSKKGNYKY